jgi:hypothetical protein
MFSCKDETVGFSESDQSTGNFCTVSLQKYCYPNRGVAHPNIMEIAEPIGKRLFRNVLGYSCITVGIIGCVLPILPGLPFIFVGLGLLAVHNPWAARLLERLRQRLGSVLKKTGIERATQKTESDIVGR